MTDGVWTTGEIASALGLTPRTLHYWDEKGLVVPSKRSGSNYRLYSEDDVARLHLVLIYRATGMSIDEIIEVLNSPDSRRDHLLRQRELLTNKLNDVHAMVHAVDKLLEDDMTHPNEMNEIVAQAGFDKYADEAEQKWGRTDDWAISQQNVAVMSQGDWADLQRRTEELETRLAHAMADGVEPGSEEANGLAEAHRGLLSAYFPVSHSKHVLIAMGYTADERFRTYYDKRAEGLASWLSSIIEANATAHGVDVENVNWE